MGVSGVSSSTDMQQIQMSMLAAVVDQQASMTSSIQSATQSADLSFMGIGGNFDAQA
jgi:hypothetical protein